jgi:hypothetical protein
MLNKNPIFINGFSYGGTNLITNLLTSHPDVCWLSGETHEVFYGKPKKLFDIWIRRFFNFPVQVFARQHIFGRRCLDKRNRVPKFIKNYIDMIFYLDKLTTDKNKIKDVKYSSRELKRCRFLAKNVNGVVLASDLFSEMYPDATFISIIRNGFALCEGYVRRGWTADDFGRMYEIVCQKIIEDSINIRNYYIVRFEDMVSDPFTFIKKIYSFANLDISKVSKIRLQSKKSMDKNGTRKYTFGGSKDREIHWFSIEDIGDFIRKDVNDNQIAQLNKKDKKIFLEKAERSMKYFGYT